MATTTRFTDKHIKNLKPREKEYWEREGQGFAIRVLPSGEKAWYFIYTFNGRKRYMRLKDGGYPDVSLADAREAFDIAKVKVKNEIDPLAEKQAERDERRKAPTIADLVNEYIERHAKRFKKSWAKDEAILNRDVVPAWGKRKAADITKRDVLLVLEGIVNRDAPAMANNCFQIIRKMFNWAVEQDILPHTPCSGVKLPSPKLARERALSESEIKALWENLGRTDLNMSPESRRALKLILVTAQRPGEVIGMHSSEIDGRWWTIPSERAKNGKAHRVYLTDTALSLVGDTHGKGYIFPTPHREKEKPIGDTALAVTVNRNMNIPITDKNGKPLFTADGKPATENRLVVDHFTPHDLRRTAATFMAKNGEMDEVIDAVLNHAKQGVIKVYNQYRYDKEKQAALEAWENKLKIILAGDKVIDLGQKRSERATA